MAIITVGTVKETVPYKSKSGKTKTKKVEWHYSDVPVNKDGWTIDLKYRPGLFDMCALLIEGKEKAVNGWWTGIEWTAIRMRSTDKVKAWKYIKELN